MSKGYIKLAGRIMEIATSVTVNDCNNEMSKMSNNIAKNYDKIKNMEENKSKNVRTASKQL